MGPKFVLDFRTISPVAAEKVISYLFEQSIVHRESKLHDITQNWAELSLIMSSGYDLMFQFANWWFRRP